MSKYSHKTKRIYGTEIEETTTEPQVLETVAQEPIDLSNTVPVTDEVPNESVDAVEPASTAEHDENESINLSDTQPIDLSDTQPLPVIVKEVPVEAHKPMPKWLPYLGGVLAILIAICGVVIHQVLQNQKPQENVKVTTTTASNQTDLKAFTASLKKTADATGTPYKVSTETIGGGYIVGVTTYNPDTATDMYMDYALAKPEKAQKQADDDTAKSIQAELKKELPTINKSIKVKDKNLVSMETYKVGDLYHTILLYNSQPFAYVVTDKDGVSTNYVTAYYVTDVAAE